MSGSSVNRDERVEQDHETSRKGTWLSVGVVGAVILITYVILFGLYMARV